MKVNLFNLLMMKWVLSSTPAVSERDVSCWNASWELTFVHLDKILCWWIKWIAFSEWCCLKIVLCNEFWNMIVEIRFYQIKGKLNLYFSAWLIIYSLTVTVSSQTTAQLTQHSSLFIYTVLTHRELQTNTQLSSVRCPTPLCWLTTCVIVFSITV